MTEIAELQALMRDNCYLLGARKVGDDMCLMMERCDGGDLSTRSFSESAAAGLARQLFMALAFLHHLQWVHQDVKPANLHLKNDRLRLRDFGAAVRFGQRSSPAGSFHYMAPEIFKEEAATSKANIWSAAMTSLFLVTGRVLLGSHPRDRLWWEKAMFYLDEIRERCPPSWPTHPLLSSFMAGALQIEPTCDPLLCRCCVTSGFSANLQGLSRCNGTTYTPTTPRIVSLQFLQTSKNTGLDVGVLDEFQAGM